MTQTKDNKQAGTTDSLFGMALAQAFTGLAFGVGAEQLWEAGEVVSGVYEERFQTKARANARNDFKLGVKNVLTDVFAGLHGAVANQSLGEMEHNTFKPSFALSAPAMRMAA